jgi:hypothetical protein
MKIHRIHPDYRVPNASVLPQKGSVQDAGSTTEVAQDRVDFGTTNEYLTHGRTGSSATSEKKPIGMAGTLKLLQEIKNSVNQPTRETEPARPAPPPEKVQSSDQVAFHLPPEEQFYLMRDNHGSLGQVKNVYSGIASQANEAGKAETAIYKDLADSLTQTWAKTRSIRRGGGGEAH